MSRYFDIRLTGTTSDGPYDIYYDNFENYATGVTTNTVATGITKSTLISQEGFTVYVPDCAQSIGIINVGASCNYVSPQSIAIQSVQLDPEAPKFGDSYGGGVVFYILQTGDTGYDATKVKGLVVPSDWTNLPQLPWDPYNSSGYNELHVNRFINVTGTTSIGSGLSNTNLIVSDTLSIYAENNYAANFALNYTGGTKTDWYLPSIDEAIALYTNKYALGITDPNNINSYWTSNLSTNNTYNSNGEIKYPEAWYRSYGSTNGADRQQNNYVIPIRTFSYDIPTYSYTLKTGSTLNNAYTGSTNMSVYHYGKSSTLLIGDSLYKDCDLQTPLDNGYYSNSTAVNSGYTFYVSGGTLQSIFSHNPQTISVKLGASPEEACYSDNSFVSIFSYPTPYTGLTDVISNITQTNDPITYQSIFSGPSLYFSSNGNKIQNNDYNSLSDGNSKYNIGSYQNANYPFGATSCTGSTAFYLYYGTTRQEACDETNKILVYSEYTGYRATSVQDMFSYTSTSTGSTSPAYFSPVQIWDVNSQTTIIPSITGYTYVSDGTYVYPLHQYNNYQIENSPVDCNIVSYSFSFGMSYSDGNTAGNNFDGNVRTTLYGEFEYMTVDKNVNFYYDYYRTQPVENYYYLANQYYSYYISNNVISALIPRDLNNNNGYTKFSTISRNDAVSNGTPISSFTYPIPSQNFYDALTGTTGTTILLDYNNGGYSGRIITGYSYVNYIIYSPSYKSDTLKINSSTAVISGPKISSGGAYNHPVYIESGVTFGTLCYDSSGGPNSNLYSYEAVNMNPTGSFMYTDDQLEIPYTGSNFHYANVVYNMTTGQTGQVISSEMCPISWTVSVSTVDATTACSDYSNNVTSSVWRSGYIMNYNVTSSLNPIIYSDQLLTQPITGSWISDGAQVIETDSSGRPVNNSSNC